MKKLLQKIYASTHKQTVDEILFTTDDLVEFIKDIKELKDSPIIITERRKGVVSLFIGNSAYKIVDS